MLIEKQRNNSIKISLTIFWKIINSSIKMKTTIAQALKQKNKLAINIHRNWVCINNYNSQIAGTIRPFEIDEILTEINNDTNALVKLKTKIHIASQPVREKIFQLSEIKSILKKLTEVPTNNGKIRDRYDSHIIDMEAIIDAAKIKQLTIKYEKDADKLQEELDAFNHTTYLT